MSRGMLVASAGVQRTSDGFKDTTDRAGRDSVFGASEGGDLPALTAGQRDSSTPCTSDHRHHLTSNRCRTGREYTFDA